MMLFLLTALFTVLSISSAQVYGPKPLYYATKEWAWRVQHNHIVNLTVEIIKDTTYKLKHAEKIQEEHKGSIGYELGTIAAGILERFLYMLKLYRKYAHIDELATDLIYLNDYMTALNHIQGAYHEIRMEKDMFFKTLERHKNVDLNERRMKRIQEMLQKSQALQAQYPGFPVRRRGKDKVWRPAQERFDVRGFVFQ